MKNMTPSLTGSRNSLVRTPRRVDLKKCSRIITWLVMITLPAFVFMAGGCTPQQRLERLVTRHPSLIATDTLHLRDTVTLPAVAADTQLNWYTMTDTVYLSRERLRVELRKVHDTLLVRGECLPDTVVIHREIPVTKYKITNPLFTSGSGRALPWIALFIAACIVLVILMFLRRR